MSRQITPGPLNVGSADALTRALMDMERLKSEVQILRQQVSQVTPDIQAFNRDRFPACITTVSTDGSCAWYKQTFTTTGARTVDPVGLQGYTNYNPAYAVGTAITAGNLPLEVELRKRTVIVGSSINDPGRGNAYEFDYPSTGGSGSGTITRILKIISGAADSFGYPAYVQTWDNTAGTWSNLNTTTVRVENPNGGGLSVDDYIEALYLGPSSGGVDCYAATPLLEVTSSNYQMPSTGIVLSNFAVTNIPGMDAMVFPANGEFLVTYYFHAQMTIGSEFVSSPEGIGVYAQIASNNGSATIRSNTTNGWVVHYPGTTAEPAGFKIRYGTLTGSFVVTVTDYTAASLTASAMKFGPMPRDYRMWQAHASLNRMHIR